MRYLLCIGMLVFALPALADEMPKAAVVKLGLPGEDPAIMQGLEQSLTAAGYKAGVVGFAVLSDADALQAAGLDLLVLPDAAELPTSCAPSLDRYLRAGGDLMALRAPLWQQSLIQVEDEWMPRETYAKRQAKQLAPHLVAKFEPAEVQRWTRSHGPEEGTSTYEVIPDGLTQGARVLHAINERYLQWDTYGTASLAQPFPAGHVLTVFSAKGDENTSQLSLEWEERDGSRWFAAVPLTTEWQQFVLGPTDFHFWESVPGRARTRFQPEQAVALRIGLANSHTSSLAPGRHEYWIGPVGTSPLTKQNQPLLSQPSQPAWDTLSPGYKFFVCNDVASLLATPEQAVVAPDKLTSPRSALSPHPRPAGGGFDKGRDWRWMPLLTARNGNRQWCGTPATLTAHAAGPYKGGAWACFAVQDLDWYKNKKVMSRIEEVLTAMRRGVYLLDGGADLYTYFPEQPVRLGVRAFSLRGAQPEGIQARVTVQDLDTKKEVFSKQWPLRLTDAGVQKLEESWKPTAWPQHGFRCTAELLAGDTAIDRVVHDAHVWVEKEKPNFVRIENGGFKLHGQPWRIHGVNYMPSSGIGTEDNPYFEFWLSARSYDPVVIDRDLTHVKNLGFNAVSIFVYHKDIHAHNLLDLLRRLDALGLKANLSLRPGTPMDFPWPQVKEMIEYNRLVNNDTVFAYDLAWEPSFGLHEERKVWDQAWADWITERYGSIEAAEKDWGFAVPRDSDGKLTNPLPAHVDTDGPWRVMTAAYRRFLDTLLYQKYGNARRLVRSIDPNHAVSFRMSEAANPTYRWNGRITYDFPYLAAAVDILEPEGYGRIGDWEKVKPGWFEVTYARWAGPHLPVMWAEAGVHTWDYQRMQNGPALLDFQARYYRDLYRMFIGSRCDGVFFWWYPGGFRVGENSDYGIIEPDGSDRAVTKVIRELGPQLLQAPTPSKPDVLIEVDRDLHTTGVTGIYEKAKDAFWRAIDAGQTPGLKTAGAGSDSIDCPLLAVGNTLCNGSNPPKYLDGAFDEVQFLAAPDRWVAVEKNGEIALGSDGPLKLRVQITNLGEARWADAKEAAGRPGAVELCIESPADLAAQPLPDSVPHFGSVLMEITIPREKLANARRLQLRLHAAERTRFGEVFSVTLKP